MKLIPLTLSLDNQTKSTDYIIFILTIHYVRLIITWKLGVILETQQRHSKTYNLAPSSGQKYFRWKFGCLYRWFLMVWDLHNSETVESESKLHICCELFYFYLFSQIPIEAVRRPGPTRIPKPKSYSMPKGTNSVVNQGQSKGLPLPLATGKDQHTSPANNLNMINRPTKIWHFRFWFHLNVFWKGVLTTF